MTVRQLRMVVLEMLKGWWEDKAPRLGAALAYYTVLALAPVVVLILPIAGAIFGREAATREIIGEFADLVGKVGAEAVRTVLDSPGRLGHPGRLATVLSVIVLLFAASGVFAQLQDAFDTIWEVRPKPGRAAVLSFLRKRFLSFAMVLGICFLLLVSLIISAGLAAMRYYAAAELKSLAWVWTIAHFVVSFGVITLLFATIFKVLPDATVAWSDVWVGAAITSALFTAGKLAIGLYLGRSSFGAFYGTAGSLVVLLVWVYYSAQILYLGAEFTKAWSRRAGHVVRPTADAVAVTEEARAQEGIARQKESRAAAEG
jgi:membrane protein